MSGRGGYFETAGEVETQVEGLSEGEVGDGWRMEWGWGEGGCRVGRAGD